VPASTYVASSGSSGPMIRQLVTVPPLHCTDRGTDGGHGGAIGPTLTGMGNIGEERRRIEVLPASAPAPAPERPEPSREPAPAR
jgi:hypothetical protein